MPSKLCLLRFNRNDIKLIVMFRKLLIEFIKGEIGTIEAIVFTSYYCHRVTFQSSETSVRYCYNSTAATFNSSYYC